MKKRDITVYAASAGSGKTFTLAASYIELLLNTEDPTAFRHVLAVTFTNKATAEMKERIMARLYDIAHGATSTEATGFREELHKRLPHLSDADMQQRAAQALHALLHDYDHFAVTTIDSFFQMLLTHLAHELGLSNGFRVDINDKEVVHRAVDRLMESLPHRPALMSSLITYITERIEENKHWNPAAEMKDLGAQLLKEKVLMHDEALGRALSSPRATAEYAKMLRTIETEALTHLTQAATDFIHAYDDAGEAVDRFKGSKYAIAYAQRLASAATATDKQKALDAPNKTLCDMMTDADAWVRASDKNKRLTAQAAEPLRIRLCELENIRREVEMHVNTCRLSRAQLSPLGLLNEIRTEVNRLNRENNRVLLAKTPQLLNNMVGNNDASFVFERVGTRFRHVMIDEFQDTSVLQWATLRRLLIESISGTGSSLLVGDVKQGIYRFRNGDWSILQNIEDEMGRERVVTRRLETNYRSGDVLIRFNNAFFAEAARQIDAYAPDTKVGPMYTDVEQQCSKKRGGYVRVYVDIPQKKNEDTENEEDTKEKALHDMAAQMTMLRQQGLPLNEMAVLVRYRYMAEEIIEFFATNYPDIKLVSDEAFLLSSSPLLQAFIQALRYLVCRENSVARLHVATYMSRHTPGCEQLTMSEIINRAESLLPDLLKTQLEVGHNSSTDPAVGGLLALPLYELCERLLTALSPEISLEEAPYVCCFLDYVINFIDDGAANAESLITLWDESLSERAVPAGDTDGVRVLTIHKSKGLAFHTVFLPQCTWELEADRKKSDLQWFAPSKEPYDRIPLLPINATKTTAHSIYADNYAEEHKWRRIENLNLLYVAFTRAKYNLYIWSTGKEELSDSSTTGHLIYASLPRPLTEADDTHIFYETGEPVIPNSTRSTNPSNEKKHSNPLEQLPENICYPMRTYRSRACFRQSNESRDFVSSSDETGNKQKSYIDQGKLLHKLLSDIRTHADLQPAIRAMLAAGLLTTTEAKNIGSLLQQRMSDPQVNTWFDGSWQIFNECSILTRDTEGCLRTYRPDRVMTKDGHTIVVDFKFGRPDPKYNTQVSNYVSLLQQMGYSHINGYLWYVYDGHIEKIQ